MADLSETGKLAEVKYGYKNVAFGWKNNKTQIRITNKNYFVNLNQYQGKWELLKNGVPVQKGSFSLPDVAPQKSAIINNPVNIAELHQSHEWLLNVSLQTTQDKLWASKGHAISEEQLVLTSFDFAGDTNELTPYFIPKQSKEETITIADDNYSVEFEPQNGILKNYKYKGQLLFEQGPKLNFWRAATDNDSGNRLMKNPNRFASQWYKAGLDDLKHELSALKIEQNRIVVNYKIAANKNNGFNAIVTYSFYTDGSIHFDFEAEAYGEIIGKLSSLPKVGTQWLLPKQMDQMEWYGRGPYHNYIDRKGSAFLGCYSASVDEQFVNYPYPQENGNKMGVRWVSMDNGNKLGLKILAQQPLEVSAHHYSTKNLDEATHTYELKPSENIFWNIDHRQCGLGNGSCGSNTRKEYCILPTKKYHFSYWMQPVKKGGK